MPLFSRFARIVTALLALTAISLSATLPTNAQNAGPAWQSTIIWAPSLAEAGQALAAHVNQINVSCNVDVDPVVSTNGAGPEGAVYAFVVAWSCPASNTSPSDATWQSAMIWDPTLAGAAAALSAHLNQTDATCRVDVDNVTSTNGAGPEGIVYAFLVTWAC